MGRPIDDTGLVRELRRAARLSQPDPAAVQRILTIGRRRALARKLVERSAAAGVAVACVIGIYALVGPNDHGKSVKDELTASEQMSRSNHARCRDSIGGAAVEDSVSTGLATADGVIYATVVVPVEGKPQLCVDAMSKGRELPPFTGDMPVVTRNIPNLLKTKRMVLLRYDDFRVVAGALVGLNDLDPSAGTDDYLRLNLRGSAGGLARRAAEGYFVFVGSVPTSDGKDVNLRGYLDGGNAEIRLQDLPFSEVVPVPEDPS